MADPVWGDEANVPRYLPPSHGLSLTALVADASRFFWDKLSRDYFQFPDYNATPSTPATIRVAVEMYAGYLGRLEKKVTDYQQRDGYTQSLRADAIAEISAYLRAGGPFPGSRVYRDDSPPVQVFPNYVATGEALSFGTGALEDDEHKFAFGELTVVEDSVEIAGFELETDFTVAFDRRHRAWILSRIDSDIDTETVSYEYSYFRQGRERPRVRRSVKLKRA